MKRTWNQSLSVFAVVAMVSIGAVGDLPAGHIVGWGYQVVGADLSGGFTAISAGGNHSLGLKQDGSVVAWGDNRFGDCDVPSPNTGFVAIAAGYMHSLGLKQDGSVVAWGSNRYRQCHVPSPNTGFKAIAAGGDHSLGLKEDGSVVAWGDNEYGQCNVPSPNTGFVAIAAGLVHSLGLKLDASVTGGNIVVNVTPETASWTLAGPAGFEGNGTTYTGDHTFTKVPVGNYTWTGNTVSGYTTPSPQTQTLTDGGTITFTKTWTATGGGGGTPSGGCAKQVAMGVEGSQTYATLPAPADAVLLLGSGGVLTLAGRITGRRRKR